MPIALAVAKFSSIRRSVGVTAIRLSFESKVYVCTLTFAFAVEKIAIVVRAVSIPALPLAVGPKAAVPTPLKNAAVIIETYAKTGSPAKRVD